MGDPFGKELTIFNFEDIFRNGQGAIQAKYVRAFGEFKMPMGVEIMSVSHLSSIRFRKSQIDNLG